MQATQWNKLVSASFLTLAITGCASGGGTTDEAATTETAVEESQTQAVPDSPEVGVQTDVQTDTNNPLLEQKIIYFGYDSSDIRPEFKDILNAHAQFLTANPQARIVLEGHCDERGTVEYNLALGERRANTIKRYLIVQGANPSQLESVSFGEERPAMIGSTEAAMSKNRRTEIKYQAQ